MKMNDLNYQHLRELAVNEAWCMTMVPIMQGRIREWMTEMLKDPSQRTRSDAELRGRVNALSEIMQCPTTLVAAYDKKNENAERLRDKEDREARQARILARTGRHGPLVPEPITDEANPISVRGE